jgi:4-alpha-glucanotransferase
MDVYDRAKELGIQTEFVDGQGHRHVTDVTALKIILEALPKRQPTRLLAGPVVIRPGKPSRTELSPAAALPVSWTVVAGREVMAKGEANGRTIAWPADWRQGIYRLRLTDADSLSEEVPLIVSTSGAFAGDFDRGWLLAV